MDDDDDTGDDYHDCDDGCSDDCVADILAERNECTPPREDCAALPGSQPSPADAGEAQNHLNGPAGAGTVYSFTVGKYMPPTAVHFNF